MKIKLNIQLELQVKSCNLKHLTIVFLSALTGLYQEFVSSALLFYFEEYYENGKLKEILKIDNYRKKTSNTRTKFKTLFGNIWVPQIQIRTTSKDGKEHQISVTRIFFGVSRQYQIPDFMKELLGWIGSVSTFRVGYNILGSLTNFKCSLMSVWHSAQWYAQRIKLKLSPDGTNEFEADGTGIPTKGSGKRGSELKIVFQKKKDGKLHLVGIAIGKYKDSKNWLSALFSPIKSGLKQFKKIILSSDGDKSITETAKSVSDKVKTQKDLWHVFHQLKYYLWQDKVPKEIRSNIISLVYKITMVLTCFSSEKRLQILDTVIQSLKKQGYKHSSVYLQSAMDGFYTYETEGNTNIYTTKTERSMRTVNQRIDVGIWSDEGALNATQIRLAYYYNGISPLNWKKEA